MAWSTRIRSWLFVLTIPSLIAGCGGENIVIGHTPTPTATPSARPTATATPRVLSSDEVLQPGALAVGVTTVVFEDTSRPTMRNGSYPGALTRRLETEIWYPADGEPTAAAVRNAPLATAGRPFPLIMYSHGFSSFRTEGGFLAAHLASYGYVVAAPTFPLTNLTAPGGANIADVPEQPRDVSFLIDQLLARSGNLADEWAGAIDAQRIGAAGLSLGGLTTFLTAFHPTLRDARVRAAAPMAGPGCFFGGGFFDHAAVPLLIVHGDLDAIVPYVQNASVAFAAANAPKYLVTIRGGSHTAFADAGQLFEAANNADDIGCAALRGDLGGAANFLDLLGGADAGLVNGDCPLPCTGPRPLPRAIRPSRQRQLTVLSVFPFFEATLRGDEAARRFLETRLSAENAEIDLDYDRGF